MSRIRMTAALMVGLLCAVPLRGDDQLPLTSWQAPLYWSRGADDTVPAAGREAQEAGAEEGALAVPTSPLAFVGITPCRVADTRDGTFPTGYGPPSMPGGIARGFVLTGRCGVPASAEAVSFNFTVTNTLGPGFLLVYPSGGSAPTVSTLNYLAAQTIANAAVVPLGLLGAIDVIPGVSGTDLIIDVNGYYAPQSAAMVTSLNSLTGAVSITAGSNVTVTPSGQSIQISSTGGGGTITGVTAGTGLTGGGSSGSVTLGIAPSGVGATQLADGGVTAGKIASAQVVKSLNGAKDAVSIVGGGGVSVQTAGATVTVSSAAGGYVLGNLGDTTLLGSGYVEAGSFGYENVLATSTSGAPSARSIASCVWTGTEMIIWGGATFAGAELADGAIYDPSTDSWRTMSTVSAPTGRWGAPTVWTGTKMVLWGGLKNGAFYNTGGIYDPTANTWVATSTTGAPSARYSHSGIWTGSRMVIWGGEPGGGAIYYDDGGIFDPTTNTWSAMAAGGVNCPKRAGHLAVWAGTKMVIWGGYAPGQLSSGGIYDFASNTWTAMSMTSAPPATSNGRGVWTGSKVFIWGGATSGSTFSSSGGLFDPATNTWTAITSSPLAARAAFAMVWTGAHAVIWGGFGSSSVRYGNGALYSPATNAWTPIDAWIASPRNDPMAVWTGSKMMVWGGVDGSQGFSNGARWQKTMLYQKL